MDVIPNSYEESRERFVATLPIVKGIWPTAILERHPLMSDPSLTIDWIHADAWKDRNTLLVISTGLHGIEGYVGSAVLRLFVDEFLARLDSGRTGLLLVHAQNPWGMKNWQRTNPANADLNRNFIRGDFSDLRTVNPDYGRLMPFLNPANRLGNITLEKAHFIWNLVGAVLRVGVRRLREGALMGEYVFPQGMYFGGLGLQEETRCLMELYQYAYQGYRRIIHIDLHSGYGPRYQMTVVTSPLENVTAEQVAQKYELARVAGANPDDFYSMHGDMNDWEYQLIAQDFPKASIFAVNFEFGTFGDGFFSEARSLRITILKNQLNQHGGSEKAGDWVNREYRELYLPNQDEWLVKVQSDAHQAFERILGKEGVLV